MSVIKKTQSYTYYANIQNWTNQNRDAVQLWLNNTCVDTSNFSPLVNSIATIQIVYGCTTVLVVITAQTMTKHYYSNVAVIINWQTLKSGGGGEGMLSCFPSKFARLAKIGSVAKAKQSLKKQNMSNNSWSYIPHSHTAVQGRRGLMESTSWDFVMLRLS